MEKAKLKKLHLNRLTVFALIFVFVFGILFARFILGGDEDSWICDKGEWVRHGNPKTARPNLPCEGQIVGNDRDEHGCIGSAGYSWCALKDKCLRVWEEKCE